MSEKTDPRTRLVAETFHDDWASGPAHAFALRAAASARRRRSARRLVIGTGLMAAVLALFFLTARPPAVAPLDPSVSVAPVAPTLAPSPSSTPVTAPAPLLSKTFPAFEIISDDELFAALHGRPLLILPGEREDRRIVVLAR